MGNDRQKWEEIIWSFYWICIHNI